LAMTHWEWEWSKPSQCFTFSSTQATSALV